MKQDMIVILDLGSHENTVVARAVRALGVYSEIYPHDITAQELKALPNVKGIIINGGPNNVIDGVEIDVLNEIYEAGFPVMAAGHDKAKCEVKLPAFGSDADAVKAAVEQVLADKVGQAFYPEEKEISESAEVRVDGNLVSLLILNKEVASDAVAKYEELIK
jgi:GMP synthase (glutamine-hydrolysing)